MPGQTPLTAYPSFDTSTLPDGSSVPDTPAHAFARGKASLIDPQQYANLVGRNSYQPVIDALSSQKNRLGSGISDANSMLDRSYGGAADSSLRGAQIVSDSNQKANQGLTDLAARLAQVAGGDPTAAAAVGQTTANQQTANTRFADIASQTQADQAAAAQRDLGSAKLGYKSSTDKAIADLALQQGKAKTEGDQAQGKAITDALGFNSQQKTAQLGRDVSSQEAWLAGQLAGPQITAGKLANENTRAGMKITQHNVAANDWTALNQAKRTQYIDAVTKWTNKNVANQMKDALSKGKTPGAELALADTGAYRAALSDWMSQNTVRGAGPVASPPKLLDQTVQSMKLAYPDSNPSAVKALALRFVQGQLGAWNAYNPKAKFSYSNGAFTATK
jgi:hypothetical protein